MVASENQPLLRWIEDSLKPRRLPHSLATASTAAALAEHWGFAAVKAEAAGLVHDVCRDWTPDQLLRTAQMQGISLSPLERGWPVLLHGPVAAGLYAQEFAPDDEVFNAVYFHTTGRPGMHGVEACLFLADAIEPGRYYPGIEAARRQCFEDFHSALLLVLDSSMEYFIGRKLPIHPLTLQARNELILGA